MREIRCERKRDCVLVSMFVRVCAPELEGEQVRVRKRENSDRIEYKMWDDCVTS